MSMGERRPANSATEPVLGLFVGTLLGLAGWFVQGNPLWIAVGAAIGGAAGMLGRR